MTGDEQLKKSLREIALIAPPCSEESEALSKDCTCGRHCQWRDRLRDAQRYARSELWRLFKERV